MAELSWDPLVPKLGVTDVDVSLVFYHSAGFRVRFRRDRPPFAYLELGGAQLMLEALHPGAWTVGVLEPPFGRGVNLQVEDALEGLGVRAEAGTITLGHSAGMAHHPEGRGLGVVVVPQQTHQPDSLRSHAVSQTLERPATIDAAP